MAVDSSLPPWLWGPPATGADAGAPGTYSPADAKRPMDVAGLAAVVADPLTEWETGQYVPTRDGPAHWDGGAWVSGVAPGPVGIARQAPAAGGVAAPAGSAGTQTGPGDAARTAAGSPGPGPQPASLRLGAGPGGYTSPVKASERPRNLGELQQRVQPVDPAPWPQGASLPMGTRGRTAHWTGSAWASGVSPGYAPVAAADGPEGTQFPGDGGETAGELHR